MFATTFAPPKKDDISNILFRAMDTNEGIKFNIIRKLDTGDAKEDFKLECGKSYDF